MGGGMQQPQFHQQAFVSDPEYYAFKNGVIARLTALENAFAELHASKRATRAAKSDTAKPKQVVPLPVVPELERHPLRKNVTNNSAFVEWVYANSYDSVIFKNIAKLAELAAAYSGKTDLAEVGRQIYKVLSAGTAPDSRGIVREITEIRKAYEAKFKPEHDAKAAMDKAAIEQRKQIAKQEKEAKKLAAQKK